MRIASAVGALVVALAMPAAASPIGDLQVLVGRWTCTYRAGTVVLPYSASFAYDLGGATLRETATFAGGGDEELFAFDKKIGWTTVVFDGSGSTTIMHGTGTGPKRIALHSVYPDASIAETIALVSRNTYTIHATVRSGRKTTRSADTCVRAAP